MPHFICSECENRINVGYKQWDAKCNKCGQLFRCKNCHNPKRMTKYVIRNTK